MTLWFGGYSQRRVIARPKTEEEAIKEINNFCEVRNFHIYYTIVNEEEPGVKRYDVGSHTEFFWLEEGKK